MVNLKRTNWYGKRLGFVAVAVIAPLLAPEASHGFAQVWVAASSELRWSFFCGCGAVALLAMLQGAQTIIKKTREDAIREERERMARDLHDTLVQSCASVSMMLEAIASTSVAQSDLLHQAREQSRQTVEEARKTISSLRSKSGEVDLVALLHVVAEEIRQTCRKPLQIKQNVSSLFVPATSADEISMTVREALRNAVRHSGTERITVELKSRREALTICVQDFGCGIATNTPAAASGHFGMLGMQERMRRLGGGIDIQTVPGGGTSVQLILRAGALRRSYVRV